MSKKLPKIPSKGSNLQKSPKKVDSNHSKGDSPKKTHNTPTLNIPRLKFI